MVYLLRNSDPELEKCNYMKWKKTSLCQSKCPQKKTDRRTDSPNNIELRMLARDKTTKAHFESNYRSY